MCFPSWGNRAIKPPARIRRGLINKSDDNSNIRVGDKARPRLEIRGSFNAVGSADLVRQDELKLAIGKGQQWTYRRPSTGVPAREMADIPIAAGGVEHAPGINIPSQNSEGTNRATSRRDIARHTARKRVPGTA